MSEAAGAYFEPTFNRSVKLNARDHRLSSNGGALPTKLRVPKRRRRQWVDPHSLGRLILAGVLLSL